MKKHLVRLGDAIYKHRATIHKYMSWSYLAVSAILLVFLVYSLFSGVGPRPAYYWGYWEAFEGVWLVVGIWLLGFYSRRV